MGQLGSIAWATQRKDSVDLGRRLDQGINRSRRLLSGKETDRTPVQNQDPLPVGRNCAILAGCLFFKVKVLQPYSSTTRQQNVFLPLHIKSRFACSKSSYAEVNKIFPAKTTI